MDRPMTVVITGGSAGVGRACARAFAARGYDVGLIARGEERLEDVAAEVRVLGRRAVAVSADVADADAVEAATERFETELGPIDVWVNNAMTSIFAPIAETGPDELRRVTDVTYHGYVHGTMSALRRMRPRDQGVIIQVGSALAYRSIPLQAAYCGAKHAVVGFTDSLRCELIHDGSAVRVTAVHLPAINTPQFRWVRSRLPRKAQPVPPIFQPEVAAQAIVWAAEHERRELLVGWPTVFGILGHKLVPGFMDRYLADAAWAGQMLERPLPERPDNLWQPVPGHQAARGAFDARAQADSPLLWADTHRGVVAAGLVAAIATVAGVLVGARHRFDD